MSTGIARFTGITIHAGALVTAIAVLTGAAILRGGAAVADSNQDEQFLALLEKEGIPAVTGVPSLIYTAHKVCRKLDAGMPADDLVDAMVNDAYGIDPSERLYASGRLARTEARFITAAVDAYCPYDQNKLASIVVNPAAGWNEPTQRVAPSTHSAVNSGGDLREPPPALDMINMPAPRQEPTGTGAVWMPHLMDGGVFVAGRSGGDRSDFDAHATVLVSLIGAVPSGEITDPSPPQPPAPPPPAAQIQTAPRPIAAPPRPNQSPPPPQQSPPPPQQSPPPPQQPPPPPQQPPPPVVAPQPGGAAGSGGGGGNGSGGNGGGSTGGSGGGRPAEPSPEPPMPPGFVTLAP
jgi:outer membrane biosynthesis protein TonB